MGEYENTIIELFDNCPGRHQIKSLAGMYNTTIEEIEKILTAAGREIPPKPGRHKVSAKAAEPQNDKADEFFHEAKDIPEAVKNCIRIRIEELKCKKTAIETELKELTDFME